MSNEYTDINTLCSMLGCTSRTLRFYEQKGIIQSTAIPFSKRRQYSEEQIQRIRKVLVLRSLGLPIAKIKVLQESDQSLIDAISERKAELNALMISKAKEYNLICEALLTLEDGGNIFEKKEKKPSLGDPQRLRMVEAFTDSFLNEYYDWCFESFSDMLKEYLPLSAFKKVVADTLKPLGAFVSRGNIQKDDRLNNVFYSYLKYEKLGLSIKLVFAKEKIHGIWLNYFHYDGEKNEKNSL